MAGSPEAPRPHQLDLGSEEEDEQVLVHCGTKRRIVPYRRSQGWASLRHRLTRIFGLKRAVWELQGRRVDTGAPRCWTVIAPPWRNTTECWAYWIIKKKSRGKHPDRAAVRHTGGLARSGRRVIRGREDQLPPRRARGDERENAPESTKGDNLGSVQGRTMPLIERHESAKPVALPGTTTKATTKTEG
jgi:hypothetical protein